MSLYTVLSRIRHDGTVYETGEKLVDVTEEAAQLLIEAGAIVKADAADVEEQVKEDAKTVTGQVQQDVAKAEEAVAAEKSKKSLLDKARSALGGDNSSATATTPESAPVDQPVAPAAPNQPPTPEEVAATAAQVQ